MDYTAAVEIGCVALTGIGGVFAYLWRRSETERDRVIQEHGEAIKDVTKGLEAHRLYVAEHYVTQSDLTKAVSSLERSIERLIEAVNQNSKETREGFAEMHRKIDTKADK
jgi:hypothetical protein